MKRPRVLPPVYLLGAIALMGAAHYLFPIRQLLRWPWRWSGVVVFATGLSLGFWAVRSFARHKTTIKPGEESSHLMTGGPFQLTRNPIYLSMVLILAGLALFLGSLTPWVAIPVFIWVINRNIIPIEEHMLTDKFADVYRQYQVRVRRWV